MKIIWFWTKVYFVFFCLLLDVVYILNVMSKTMVSIIIPTYNNEDTIARALTSVAAQTVHDWQIVVVNDCSTDNTVKVVEDNFKRYYKDKIKMGIRHISIFIIFIYILIILYIILYIIILIIINYNIRLYIFFFFCFS